MPIKKAFSLYNASAGSGKTYTLVKEYLRILLESPVNDAYRRILAITFTNKAVEEMKRRIVLNLSDFAKDEPGARAEALMKDLSAETGLSMATIKDKAKAIIKNIIHNYAAFDISTIDRFTHKVIRAFAHDLNLSLSFDVSLETDLLLQEAVDAVIARAGNDEVLTGLLVDFSLDKTDDDKSWDITYELLETGKLLIDENNRNELKQFQGKDISHFLFIREKLKQQVKILEEESRTLGHELDAVIAQQGIDPKSFSRGTFTNHIGYIKDGALKPTHKKYYEADEVAINKAAKDLDAIEGVLPQMLALLQQVYKNYEKKNFYTAFLKNITPLSLLNSIGEQMERIQKEQNILSISEFNAIIHREIQNQPAPFIYERLGERYRHFFIDEFQDTSQMQWQNLIPLIGNALAGEDPLYGRGSLLLVGDAKQSIYRWRGGHAEQFIDLAKPEANPFSNPDKHTFNLDTNYRSFDEVINFNNEFFNLISAEFENTDYRQMYAESNQQFNIKNGGYVSISFLPEMQQQEEVEPADKNTLYLEATLQAINSVLEQGFSYRDIVLLTRKRQPGVLLANYLTEQGIPILSSETLLIENATEVKLIINILRYLKNSNNKEARAYFLYFAASTRQEADRHNFIARGMGCETEAGLEDWLAQHGIIISFNSCRKKSLYEAVETIVRAFIPNKANQSYVQYFMDLVLERDIRTQAGISDFLDYWDNNGSKFSIPSPEGNDAVRIMTIHKSKGLEFPVVIFPFAEEDYARSRRDKLWLELDDETFEFQKALIDSSKAVAEYGEKAAALYHIKSQQELLDNINILYVALTRAEEQLHIISSRNFTSKGELTNNMSSFFIRYLMQKGLFDNTVAEYTFGSPQRLSEPEPPLKGQQTIQVVGEPLDMGSVKIARREALMWGTQRQEAIEFGNVMHQILSYINIAEDIGNALQRAVEEGLITVADVPMAEQTLQNIVHHEALNEFFAEGATVYNEQNIIGRALPTVKPDRVVLRGNKAWLLDYKTGTHQDKYVKQLRNYQEVLELMDLEVEKKTLVYIRQHIEVVEI
ncbi:UvrD-helicase domain-containing protein [Flavobacterium rhizosphaerae]|uniref:DNA 3'-5' helicase n=1 Tax=Flavobacterium rhizosphaerae TaxID=3163298 RepID=A0ABW8Z156_9FLAO